VDNNTCGGLHTHAPSALGASVHYMHTVSPDRTVTRIGQPACDRVARGGGGRGAPPSQHACIPPPQPLSSLHTTVICSLLLHLGMHVATRVFLLPQTSNHAEITTAASWHRGELARIPRPSQRHACTHMCMHESSRSQPSDFNACIARSRSSTDMTTTARALAVATLIGGATAQCASNVNKVRNGGFEAEGFGGGK
jgi:hypothetical protein